MAAPIVGTLPTAPQRVDSPSTFIARADAWVAAVSTWTTQVNALATYIDTVSGPASDAAIAAAETATEAAETATAAAASAVNAPGSRATSSTSLTLGTGSKSFTLNENGKLFVPGQWVSITDLSNPASKWMLGAITAFSGINMTVEVAQFQGLGSNNNWAVVAAAPTTVAGARTARQARLALASI